jgi:hypothetical protein
VEQLTQNPGGRKQGNLNDRRKTKEPYRNNLEQKLFCG